MNVLAICGSLRRESYNRKLLELAKAIAIQSGAHVTTADLKALNLPMYDFDIESAGIPQPVRQLGEMIVNADVLIIASPEYNYSVSGVLKNAIDWVSRIKPNPFSGKIAAICGASTGPFGTVRGQNQLRQILTTVNVTVIPQPQVLLMHADTAFTADGALTNAAIEKNLKDLLHTAFARASMRP